MGPSRSLWGGTIVLILSRKCGQSIVINDDIVVTVIAVERNRVQIGIQAPGYVPIFRQEIVERMVASGEIEPLACLHPPQPAGV
jgi:carbon storage regulator